MDNYSFDKIGKRMPYRVPETFFDDIETRILAETRSPRKSRNILKFAYRGLAVAASLTLLFIATNPDVFSHKTDFAEVAQAFDNLSDADRAFLLDIYQDDIFINEE